MSERFLRKIYHWATCNRILIDTTKDESKEGEAWSGLTVPEHAPHVLRVPCSKPLRFSDWRVQTVLTSGWQDVQQRPMKDEETGTWLVNHVPPDRFCHDWAPGIGSGKVYKEAYVISEFSLCRENVSSWLHAAELLYRSWQSLSRPKVS
jgi:hypothetical protein